MIVCIAGKNDVACDCLEHAMGSGLASSALRVVCNADDAGRHTWQRSLRFTASRAGVEEITLDAAQQISGLTFFSIEFDRIIRPDWFQSSELFNIHFSRLPAYKGVATSVWPIMHGETEVGVSLHMIDAGIDTGDIVDQVVFPLATDWTARDLYAAFLQHGASLFARNLELVLSGAYQRKPQPAEGASYWSRRDLNFSSPPLRLDGTAWQAHNSLRALTFWEYQLPTVAGRKVLASRILPSRSVRKAGDVALSGSYGGVLSTRDFDVELRFSPYDDLFAWARGEGESLPDVFTSSEWDIDRADRNGWNAAVIAAFRADAPRLRMLLDKGASPNFANRRGTTLFMYAKSGAVEREQWECLELLLSRGANPDSHDATGKTVFDYLAAEGRPDVGSMIRAMQAKSR